MTTENESIKGYRFAGDIEIKNISLISQLGQVIDISAITVEVSIFQDIFEHYLQCELVISDSLALINSLKGDQKQGLIGGFNGGEVLCISYRTRDKELPFRHHFFALYELSDRQRINEKTETYLLSGISAEAYQSSTRKISRAYGGSSGSLISSMAKSVIDEFVYNKEMKDIHRNYRSVLGFRIEKEVNIDNSTGLQKFVIPNMTADDTIDFFAREADNDSHIPFFLFYEDTKGFNFRDLNTLITAEPKATFYYIASNTPEERKKTQSEIKDYEKIISYNVITQSNLLEKAKGGLFRQKVINLDILKKNKNEVIFEYDKEVSRFNKLQKFNIPGASSGDPIVHLMTSRLGHDVCCPIFEPENHLPKRINQFIARKRSYRNHIMNTKLEVVINGDSELLVGDVIYLNIPNATTLEKDDGKEDKYLSGKYITTKVRHKFGGKSGEQFVTIIECYKDTGIKI